MLKYCKVIDENTKLVLVGLGNDEDYYISHGFVKKEVELSYDASYYLKGYAPQKSAEDLKLSEKIRLKQELEANFYEKYPLYKQCNIAIYGSEEERQKFKEFHDKLVNEYDLKIKKIG